MLRNCLRIALAITSSLIALSGSAQGDRIYFVVGETNQEENGIYTEITARMLLLLKTEQDVNGPHCFDLLGSRLEGSWHRKGNKLSFFENTPDSISATTTDGGKTFHTAPNFDKYLKQASIYDVSDNPEVNSKGVLEALMKGRYTAYLAINQMPDVTIGEPVKVKFTSDATCKRGIISISTEGTLFADLGRIRTRFELLDDMLAFKNFDGGDEGIDRESPLIQIFLGQINSQALGKGFLYLYLHKK